MKYLNAEQECDNAIVISKKFEEQLYEQLEYYKLSKEKVENIVVLNIQSDYLLILNMII